MLVDFQTRASDIYQEAIRRVHAGDIGPVVSGESVYYCGTTWNGDALKADPKDPENREIAIRAAHEELLRRLPHRDRDVAVVVNRGQGAEIVDDIEHAASERVLVGRRGKVGQGGRIRHATTVVSP